MASSAIEKSDVFKFIYLAFLAFAFCAFMYSAYFILYFNGFALMAGSLKPLKHIKHTRRVSLGLPAEHADGNANSIELNPDTRGVSRSHHHPLRACAGNLQENVF